MGNWHGEWINVTGIVALRSGSFHHHLEWNDARRRSPSRRHHFEFTGKPALDERLLRVAELRSENLDDPMNASDVLLAAIAALVLWVWWFSGKYGGRHRGGRSIRRGANSHFTVDGHAKKGYASREGALAEVARIHHKDEADMGAYQCAQCKSWHVGHARSRR